MAGLASTALVAGMAVAASPAQAGQAGPTGPDQPESGPATVEQQVRDELADDGTTDFWVYLDAQADLTAAASIADRAEQGWFVYDQLTATATDSQQDLLAMLDAAGVPHRSFWIANTVKVTGDEKLLDRIAALPEVAEITADRTYALPEPIPAGDEPGTEAVEWGVAEVKAPQVWDTFGTQGEDIVVGSIDTGVLYNHPAVVNQYRGNLGGGEFDHAYNWHDPSNVCGSPSLEPCDNNGHGTHVTGTMVGDDGEGNQIGVAPAAQWISAKGCEASTCSSAALLSSGQFILAPTDLDNQNPNPELRPHIVNNSWGGGADTDPWYQPTVEAWVAAGIFPQFANGNNIPGCGASGNPGNLAASYAAGAYDINGNMAGFSNRGPSAWSDEIIKPNIAAPGVAIRSAWNDGAYSTISGTSMASPHVSGVVALIWSAAVTVQRDIEATRELLDLTAIDTDDTSCGGTAENNNVWGQGRLDAFAAVEESPRGPTGTLAGTVTDAGTGAPINGASITVTGEVDRERSTGSDGGYSATLPAGDYTVTATAFGYAEQTDTVTIVENEVTTQDFAMAAVDSVMVSGQVTDGSGHGWPLYAQVSAQGTPLSTYTDPATGDYSLAVPAGATYTLVAESEYPGYADATATIEVGDGDLTQDLTPEVDQCQTAPGYVFSGTIGVMGDHQGMLAEYLDSQGIPSSVLDWGDDVSGFDSIIINRPGDPGEEVFLDFLADTDAAGTGVVFLDTWSTLGNGVWLLWQHTGDPSNRAIGFSSSIPYLFYEVVEEHPVVAGFEAGDEIIFDEASNDKDHAWFEGYQGQVIAQAGRSDTGVVGQGIGVEERDNNRHVLMSMHAAGTFTEPGFWTEDGAQLFLNAIEWTAPGASFDCGLVDGGLVVGQVTDANTGDGVNGATVASDDRPEERGRSAATPDDPALADGFYWLFSSGTGSQQFTASASGYGPLTETVDVTADAASQADFALAAGQLTVSPGEVSTELRIGQSDEQSFTITNDGGAPAEVELSERRGSFELLGSDSEPAGSPGEVRLVEGSFSPAAQPMINLPFGGSPEAGTPETGPAADPWTDLPNYPRSMMDTSATVVDGTVYSFGGYDGVSVAADAYAFDPAAGEWNALADLPGARQKAEVVEIDGLVYILGGWDGTGGSSSSLFIYDRETDSYTEGADAPAPVTAPGVAVLDGQLYAAGGCTNGACDPLSDATWRYDPAADEWETLADYPDAVGWLGCGGLDGLVVCTGGTDGATASTATYAYDPGSDSWSQRADLPYDNWAMSYAPVDGQLVVSGGVTEGFNLVTNQGAAYDPGSDVWTEIEPSNNTVYRAGGACGFYKVGGSTGGFSPAPVAEQHPELGECATGEVDVPWMSVSPLTATLAPGESLTVTVSMDADVEQPGTYTAGVNIGHDTPYQVDPVGVTMVVTPPNNWGKLTGDVIGVTCDGTTEPVAGALVQVNGRHQEVTLFTDADGGYGYWLPVNNNKITLIVAANGYIPQTRGTSIKPGQEVMENFVLQALC